MPGQEVWQRSFETRCLRGGTGTCASPSIASCAVIWSAVHRQLSRCGKSIHSSAN